MSCPGRCFKECVRRGPQADIAIHCSGSSASKWRPLTCKLGDNFAGSTPDLIGHGSMGDWTGERAFTLSDEAAHSKEGDERGGDAGLGGGVHDERIVLAVAGGDEP